VTTSLHSVTWLVWAIAVTVSLQLARNPLLVAITLAVVWLVVETHRRPGSLARAFPVVLAMAVAFGVLRVLLIGLTTPLDADSSGTALVTLPQATLPTALGGFSVGGAVSQSVVLQTAIDSLVVVGIIATFGAFNAVASHHELLGAAPRAFHEPGLVLTVAMAFVPSTLDAATAAREADRARTGGVRVRRGRTLRLALPVLETGLERAVLLAESMDSRGYGRVRPQPLDRLAVVLSGVALLGLASSVVALVGQSAGLAAALAGAAVVALVAAVVLSGRSAPTRYRPRRLTRRDALVMAGVLAVPVVLALCAAADVRDLAWDPAVLPLRWPSLPVVPALALVGLALPAAIRPAAAPGSGGQP
jgi:energy-coupling factor transport system permease protein